MCLSVFVANRSVLMPAHHAIVKEKEGTTTTTINMCLSPEDFRLVAELGITSSVSSRNEHITPKSPCHVLDTLSKYGFELIGMAAIGSTMVWTLRKQPEETNKLVRGES